MKRQSQHTHPATAPALVEAPAAGGADVAARVYRGDGVEAIHYASVAVVDGDGNLTHYLGDPDLAVMARSAIKPFQVLPLLTTGAFDHYQFSARHLAIMCGSHNGTDEHREMVLSNLERTGHRSDDLQCGGHWPLWMQLEEVFPRNGEDEDPLRHNCSGKHSGFLALAKFLGVDKESYLDPNSESQRLVKQAVAEFCESPIEKMPTSIDGCSAPNFPLSLYHFALGFKKLVNLETGGVTAGWPTAGGGFKKNGNPALPSPRGRAPVVTLKQALARVREAMITHPEMVSGEKRFDLDLMRSFPSRVLCKVGAESIEGIGFCEPPLGIAVKIHDGNWRALGAVCVAVLKQLDLVKDINDFPLLKRHEMPEVRNCRKILTGRIVTEFELRQG